MNNRLDEKTLRARYEAGVKAHTWQRQQYYAAVAAVGLVLEAYDDTASKSRRMAKAAHYAQLFCIAFAFITPNLLFMAYAF